MTVAARHPYSLLTHCSRWITADPMRFSCSMVALSSSSLLGGPMLSRLNSRRVCSGSLKKQLHLKIFLKLSPYLAMISCLMWNTVWMVLSFTTILPPPASLT